MNRWLTDHAYHTGFSLLICVICAMCEHLRLAHTKDFVRQYSWAQFALMYLL
jgi:hypothetical protein